MRDVRLPVPERLGVHRDSAALEVIPEHGTRALHVRRLGQRAQLEHALGQQVDGRQTDGRLGLGAQVGDGGTFLRGLGLEVAPHLGDHRRAVALGLHKVEMRGVPRALVRLLKTVKADVEEEQSIRIDFSSFDICSLVYRFHRGTSTRLDMPLELLRGELQWMVAVAQNSSLREGVKVVDDSRHIFDTPSKAEAFGKLTSELGKLWLEAMQEQPQRVLLTDSYRA